MNGIIVEFIRTVPVKNDETREYLVKVNKEGVSFQRLMVQTLMNCFLVIGKSHSSYLISEFELDIFKLTPNRIRDILEEESFYFSLIDGLIRLVQDEDKLEGTTKEEQLAEIAYNLASCFEQEAKLVG